MGRAFAREKGLEEHADLFAKGAVLAQDPLNFESVDFLDEQELKVLRREVSHKVSLCAGSPVKRAFPPEGESGAFGGRHGDRAGSFAARYASPAQFVPNTDFFDACSQWDHPMALYSLVVCCSVSLKGPGDEFRG